MAVVRVEVELGAGDEDVLSGKQVSGWCVCRAMMSACDILVLTLIV